MALHPTSCEICERIRTCKNGTHPGLIAELDSGWAVLGDSQYFRGYSLLLCKTPAADLEELPLALRLRFLEEMAQLSEAVHGAVTPHKMNLESLGNLVPHLHWHVFPRQLAEPTPSSPVWLVMPGPDEAGRYALDPSRDGELIRAIREELARLRAPGNVVHVPVLAEPENAPE